MKMNRKHIIPAFKTKDEEARFWASHDSTDYVGDTEDVSDLFIFSPNLIKRIKERARKKQIALRLECWQIEQARKIAQKQHVPYQSLMREWIREGIQRSIPAAP